MGEIVWFGPLQYCPQEEVSFWTTFPRWRFSVGQGRQQEVYAFIHWAQQEFHKGIFESKNAGITRKAVKDGTCTGTTNKKVSLEVLTTTLCSSSEEEEEEEEEMNWSGL